MQRNYQFYYIYGLSIKVLTKTFYPETNGQPYMRTIESGTIPKQNDFIPSSTDIKNAQDFQIIDANGTFDRYYKIGKYLKGVKEGW